MARELRGSDRTFRCWRDRDRNAGAAALASNFVPEDAFDVQPLANEERVFVCQARLDNREDLLRELAIDDGAALADSSLLAAAYDRWGDACVQKLTGDFAFAAWHRNDGRVVAAVDPVGNRRLLWTRIGSGIAVAAQLPSLLAHPGVSRDPDLAAMAAMLGAGVDRTTTAFTAIRSVPGGHVLTARGGETRIERWWNPQWKPTIWYRDPQQYVEETRELLERALTAQLRSSSPVSSTLSGGLDSGVVTAMAARILATRGERMTVYTSAPERGLAVSQMPNWEPDETGYAAQVVAGLDNVDHRLVAVAGRCSLDVLPSIHETSRTPVKTASNMLWIDRIFRSAAAAGSRVVLTGQNGNGQFSWRGTGAIAELATYGHLRAAWAQATAEATVRRTLRLRVLAGAVRGGLRAAGPWKMRDEPPMPALQFLNERSRLQNGVRRRPEKPGTRRFWAVSSTKPRHSWWPETVLQWGIEWRDPTADRTLIDRLLQYPQSAFRIDGRDRGLARAVAAGLLPDSIRLRTARGLQAADTASLIAAHADRYRAALESMRSSALCREVFDLPSLHRTVDAFAGGTLDYALAVSFDAAFSVASFLLTLERKG